MTCGIYKLINKRTGEVYVGQSKNIEYRIKTHLKELENNTHHNKGIQEDYNNGDRFDYEIIVQLPNDEKTLNQREMIEIDNHDSFYHGYNRTPGGNYDQSKGAIGYGGGRLNEESSINIVQKNNLKDPSYDYEMKGLDLFLTSNAMGKINWEECLKYFSKAHDLNPNNANAKSYTGLCLYKLKRYDEALEIVNSVLESDVIIFDKSRAEQWYKKGRVLEAMGSLNEALECYNKSLELYDYNESKIHKNKLEKSIIQKEKEEKENKLLQYLKINTKDEKIITKIIPLIKNETLNTEQQIKEKIKEEENKRKELIKFLKTQTEDKDIIKTITSSINNETITEKSQISNEINKIVEKRKIREKEEKENELLHELYDIVGNDKKIIDKITPLIKKGTINTEQQLKEKIKEEKLISDLKLYSKNKTIRNKIKPLIKNETITTKEQLKEKIKEEEIKKEKEKEELIKFLTSKYKGNSELYQNIKKLIENETITKKYEILDKINEQDSKTTNIYNESTELRYCPECGNKLNSYDKFCDKCGYNIKENKKTEHSKNNQTKSNNTNYINKNNKSKNNKKSFWTKLKNSAIYCCFGTLIITALLMIIAYLFGIYN